jgi:hypothetical protein
MGFIFSQKNKTMENSENVCEGTFSYTYPVGSKQKCEGTFKYCPVENQQKCEEQTNKSESDPVETASTDNSQQPNHEHKDFPQSDTRHEIEDWFITSQPSECDYILCIEIFKTII